MNKDTKLAVRVFACGVLNGDYGRNKKDILAFAKRYFKRERLTPDQIALALALLMKYLPTFLDFLKATR